MYIRLLILNLLVEPGGDSRYLRTSIGIHPVMYDGNDRYHHFFNNIIDERKISLFIDRYPEVLIICNKYHGNLFNKDQVIEVRWPQQAISEIKTRCLQKKISEEEIRVFSAFKLGYGFETIVDCFDLNFCKNYLIGN